MTFLTILDPESEMVTEKSAIIVEFITKTQYLAYANDFGMCIFCGGGRTYDKHLNWYPNHMPFCLYARAEEIVLSFNAGKH